MAKKQSQPKITRITLSWSLSKSKLFQLRELALRLAPIRTRIWDEYGSFSGVGTDPRKVRNTWTKAGIFKQYDVPISIARETMRDAFANIDANREAAFTAVIRTIYRRTQPIKDEVERDKHRKALIKQLRMGQYLKNKWLHREVRKHWHRGHNHTDDQIILEPNCYEWFTRDGHGWIKVQGIEPYKRIAIPLTSNDPITSTIRIIVRDDNSGVDIHYTVDEKPGKPAGTATLAVDKGFTEVFTDSNGDRYGKGLGTLLVAESDRICKKGKARNKLYALAKKHKAAGRRTKAHHIYEQNLGKQKKRRHITNFRSIIRTLVYVATHELVDKANTIVSEDLSHQFKPKDKGATWNRRLSFWMRSVIQEASDSVSRRRGATHVPANSAYTSQVCSLCGAFGRRHGGKFHCSGCRVVLDEDWNAAVNILHRKGDPEISLWTPHRKVKSILEERYGHRVSRPTQDSSCTAAG